MTFNHSGLLLIKAFEGFKPNAYLDSGGIPTIGFGFTKNVKMGDVITQEAAEARLLEELRVVSGYVDANLIVELTDNQFSAVVSLVYNIGCGRFATSKILKLLNLKDYANAALEFDRWDKCSGEVIPGLLTRRQAETALFLS